MTGLGHDYWKLLAAGAASNLADGLRFIAYPWLASTLTREPALVAGVLAAQRLPWLVLSLPVGALVDRADRRRLMIAASGLRLLLTLALVAAVAVGWLTLPLLYVVALGMGVAEVVYDNALQTILPRLVPTTALERANGQLWTAELVANEFVGPPLGGLLLGMGLLAPFLADAGGVTIALVALTLIGGDHRAGGVEPGNLRSLRAEIAEGVRWLLGHELLRLLAILLALMNLVMFGYVAVFVLFAQEVLGLSPEGFGLLYASGAVGGVLGAQAGSWLSRRFGAGTVLRATLLGPSLGFAVAAVSSSAVLIGVVFAAIAFLGVSWNIVTVSLRQAVIPDRLLGRVNSVYRLLGWGAAPVGAALAGVLVSGLTGPLGRETALRAPFVLASVVHIAAFTAAFRSLTTARVGAARRT